MGESFASAPQVAISFVEYILSHGNVQSNLLSSLGRLALLCEKIDLINTNKNMLFSAMDFYIKNEEFFSKHCSNGICELFKNAFPSVGTEFFEEKTELFKAFLFMQILVENFSKIGLNSFDVLEVLFGIRKSNDSYSGHTFNAYYGSESIFNIFSSVLLLYSLIR